MPAKKAKQGRKTASEGIIGKFHKSQPAKKSMQKDFELLEHTADAKFVAHGKTFPAALANCVKATISIMTDASQIKKRIKKTVEVKSKSRESLTYDFLEKIIFLIDTEGFLTKEVIQIRVAEKKGEFALKAELAGDNAKNYDVHTCIKAVTYNDMEIIQSDRGCVIQVVLDI